MAFWARSRRCERGELQSLRSLLRLSHELQSSLDLDVILRVAATGLRETFGFRAAAIYLVGPEADMFQVHATVGDILDQDRELFRLPVPRRIWDELFQTRYQIGSSFFVDQCQHEWTKEQLRYLPAHDLGPRRLGEWQRSDVLLIPLNDRQGELMGVLYLGDPRDRVPPTVEHVKRLEMFATSAAMSIQNARLFEQLGQAPCQPELQLLAERC
jgi:GAF domain-containing protein